MTDNAMEMDASPDSPEYPSDNWGSSAAVSSSSWSDARLTPTPNGGRHSPSSTLHPDPPARTQEEEDFEMAFQLQQQFYEELIPTFGLEDTLHRSGSGGATGPRPRPAPAPAPVNRGVPPPSSPSGPLGPLAPPPPRPGLQFVDAAQLRASHGYAAGGESSAPSSAGSAFDIDPFEGLEAPRHGLNRGNSGLRFVDAVQLRESHGYAAGGESSAPSSAGSAFDIDPFEGLEAPRHGLNRGNSGPVHAEETEDLRGEPLTPPETQEERDHAFAVELQRQLQAEAEEEDARPFPGGSPAFSEDDREMEDDNAPSEGPEEEYTPREPYDHRLAHVAWHINHLLLRQRLEHASPEAMQQLLGLLREHHRLLVPDDRGSFGGVHFWAGDDLDVDNMSYEQLLALRDQYGVVTRGVEPEELGAHTSVQTLRAQDICTLAEVDSEQCRICYDEYEVGGVVRLLRCHHAFHQHCLDRWLGDHRTCPFCKREVVP